MKKGREVCRAISVFILHKILQNKTGLDYICRTDERLSAVAIILNDIIEEMDISEKLAENNKLVKQVLRCFVCLSENKKSF